MLERPSWRGTDRASIERLALQMLDGGPAMPFRMYYTLLRACSALLDGNMAIAADVAQCQIDAAVFGASAGLGAAVTMVMEAR
jgi:hypothetical protein